MHSRSIFINFLYENLILGVLLGIGIKNLILGILLRIRRVFGWPPNNFLVAERMK